ncbi:MAG: SprT family zinc-dependent metalloprotease [Gemmatimonadota bacterium]|nr:SprT family zinc-dependent metalloprotease [Gemmatimonadota bacterium]
MKPYTPETFREALRAYGATRLERVTFRRNRSTVWSLTRRGTALNVHVAYRTAPHHIIEAFATIVRAGGDSTPAARKARRTVLAWPELARVLREVRSARGGRKLEGSRRCCGTEAQRAYLRTLYRHFNRTRFAGFLPDDIPLRLSNRMRTALGHMRPGRDYESRPRIVEIALNVDLLLAGNGAVRVDTLLHEMAHAADYLTSGERGHGASWRAWARFVGCRPERIQERSVIRRRNRRSAVTRVPPLPPDVT